MARRYPGPLRDEPLSIELHNTHYAAAGQAIDGLADQSAADLWLGDLAHRLPQTDLPPGAWPPVAEIVALRENVRVALHAAIQTGPQDPATLEAINATSARAASAPIARWRPHAPPELGTTYLSATRADVLLGAFAADAIDLLTGPRRRRPTRLRGAGLRPALPQEPPPTGLVLQRLRQPRAPSPPLPTRPPHRTLKQRPTRPRLPPSGQADPVAPQLGPSARLRGWA